MNSSYPLDTNMAKPSPKSFRKDWERLRGQFSRQIAAYLFLLPALLAFAFFAWYPILNSIQMSFQDVSITGPSTWVGLHNYTLMFKDPAFGIVWKTRSNSPVGA